MEQEDYLMFNLLDSNEWRLQQQQQRCLNAFLKKIIVQNVQMFWTILWFLYSLIARQAQRVYRLADWFNQVMQTPLVRRLKIINRKRRGDHHRISSSIQSQYLNSVRFLWEGIPSLQLLGDLLTLNLLKSTELTRNTDIPWWFSRDTWNRVIDFSEFYRRYHRNTLMQESVLGRVFQNSILRIQLFLAVIHVDMQGILSRKI